MPLLTASIPIIGPVVSTLGGAVGSIFSTIGGVTVTAMPALLSRSAAASPIPEVPPMITARMSALS